MVYLLSHCSHTNFLKRETWVPWEEADPNVWQSTVFKEKPTKLRAVNEWHKCPHKTAAHVKYGWSNTSGISESSHKAQLALRLKMEWETPTHII